MEYAYHEVLQVAMSAALAAGDVLRQELLRFDGPECWNPNHAEADVRAEQIIRERLRTASPHWSFRGEEIGYYAADVDSDHIWIVDPNDGTSWFCAGWRGSAVSIALVRDGWPVLGVVYAHSAPDNAGDLFGWAEGCGPMLRNGTSCVRQEWAQEMTQDTVVLVSPGADRRPAANLERLSPARYRTSPSIAYRLALVAAGEGEVGLSLAGGVAWDFAAGHALLRSAGGDLIHESGDPVRYSRDGHRDSLGHFCFGGSPALIQEVARRDWTTVWSMPRSEPEPYDLARPLRGGAVADDGVLQRSHGCLMGQLTGDALGSMVEFRTSGDLHGCYPQGLRVIGPSRVWDTIAGQPTDDSELALVLARTLIENGAYSEQDAIRAYAYYLQTGAFDVGGTIRRAVGAAVRALTDRHDPVEAAHRVAIRQSEANGALMRQSVLGVWGHALTPENLDAVVRIDTQLTHPNRVCCDASAAHIVALASVIREGLNAEAAYDRAVRWDRNHGQSGAVTRALLEAELRMPVCDESNRGHVIIALQAAWHAALHSSSYEDGVVRVVMAGGDTDTNGAIAAALLGALHGAKAIPQQWKQAVLSCRPQRDVPGVRQPRPHAFWPVDVYVLAERLLHNPGIDEGC